MALIESGANGAIQWTIDSGSNAGRVTLYDINGNPLAGVDVISIISQVMSALTEVAEITLSGQANCSVQLLGTTGTLTISFQASINDGYSWFSVNGTSLTTETTVSFVTADGVWFIDVSGYTNVRCIVSSYTSGSTNVSMVAVPQERSPSSTPITGSVTSNQGNPSSLSLAWPVELTDGYFVLGTVSHPVQVNVDGYVQTNPNVFVTNFPATYAVTQSTSPWVSNVTQFGSNNVVTGTGTSGLGIPRVTVSNDSSILATQSGIWTVQPGNTANTTPWLVTDSSDGPVTPGTVAGKSSLIGGQFNTALPTLTNTQQSAIQLDSSGRVLIGAIPTGANVIGAVTQSGTWTDTVTQATAANLNATVIGTTAAGSGASTGLFTIQGNAGGTPVPVTGTLTTSTDGYVTTSAPTYTNNTFQAFSLTTAGLLRIDGSGVTQPVSGTVTANQGTSPWVSNVTQFGSSNVVTGTGVSGAGIPRVTVSNDSNILATQSGAWTATVTQATAANLNATVVGTVTANIGTTNGLALDTSVNGILVAQASTTSGEKGPLIQGAVTTAAPTYTTGQTDPISLTTAGAVRVDGSGVTQPVSGTVAATQSGTWTVQPGNTANTTPWLTTINQGGNSATVTGANALKVDGSAVTQPISGTVTSNIGTTNGLALDATVTKLTIIQGTALGANTQTMVGGSVTTASPTYTTGNINPLSLTTAGALRVDGSGVTQPISGTISVGPVTVSQSDITGTGTLNALNSAATITALAGAAGIGMQLLAGTLIGTIVPEISNDGGTTWVASFFEDPITGNKSSSIVFGSANTATTRMIITSGGLSSARVRVSAFTSGTATCNLRASTQVDTAAVLFDGAAGSVPPPTIIQDGGSVTTVAPTYTTGTLNALSLNTSGGLRVDGSGVVQPVSGTVTVNQGTSPWVTQDTVADGYLATIATNTGAQSVDFTQSGTITSLNGTVSINGQGVYTVTASITGTWAGTLIAEGQLADSTWVTIPMYVVTGSLPYASVFSTTSNGTFVITGGGYPNIRIRASNYVSGTASVALDGSLSQQTVFSAQLGQWAITNQGTNSFGNVLPITATLKNGINNLNVVDENALNKLDGLYLKLDELISLLTLNGIVNKPTAIRSQALSQSVLTASTTATIMLNGSVTRIGAMFSNDNVSINNLYLLFNTNGSAGTASTTNYTVVLKPGSYYEVPFGFAGRIDGIWNGASGTVYITEVNNGNV